MLPHLENVWRTRHEPTQTTAPKTTAVLEKVSRYLSNMSDDRKHPMLKKRSVIVDFACAGSATASACVLSNPMEVVKTRMQMQGELQAA
jgi:hypothetical protein